MKPIIDPRDGDIEDDASSTKRRSLFSLAGSLLVEISLPKLAIGLDAPDRVAGHHTRRGAAPRLALDLAPFRRRLRFILTGIWPVVLLLALARLGLVRRASSHAPDRKQLLVSECLGGSARLHRLSRGASTSRRTTAPARRQHGSAGLGPCGQRRGVGFGDQRGSHCGSSRSLGRPRAGSATSRISRRRTCSSRSRWRTPS